VAGSRPGGLRVDPRVTQNTAGGFLDELLEAADLPSVFLAALLEKFIPVLPSYVLFPAIGMGAADSADLALRCLVATVGSVGGAAGWYALGASIGPARIGRLVARFGHWVLLTPEFYERLAASYARRPFRITFAGQLIPTVRIFQALPAGVLRLPLLPFLAATGAGAFCWIVPLAVAGRTLRQFGWTASQAGLGLLLGIVAAEALALLVARRGTRKRPNAP
jgi:alkaline phosphatase